MQSVGSVILSSHPFFSDIDIEGPHLDLQLYPPPHKKSPGINLASSIGSSAESVAT